MGGVWGTFSRKYRALTKRWPTRAMSYCFLFGMMGESTAHLHTTFLFYRWIDTKHSVSEPQMLVLRGLPRLSVPTPLHSQPKVWHVQRSQVLL